MPVAWHAYVEMTARGDAGQDDGGLPAPSAGGRDCRSFGAACQRLEGYRVRQAAAALGRRGNVRAVCDARCAASECAPFSH